MSPFLRILHVSHICYIDLVKLRAHRWGVLNDIIMGVVFACWTYVFVVVSLCVDILYKVILFFIKVK